MIFWVAAVFLLPVSSIWPPRRPFSPYGRPNLALAGILVGYAQRTVGYRPTDRPTYIKLGLTFDINSQQMAYLTLTVTQNVIYIYLNIHVHIGLNDRHCGTNFLVSFCTISCCIDKLRDLLLRCCLVCCAVLYVLKCLARITSIASIAQCRLQQHVLT